MAAWVGVGTGAMGTLLLGKLSDLLVGEYKLQKGVRKEVEFLKRELGRMHVLLRILADMEEPDDLGKDWKVNVRDLSYDLEDCIDRFVHRLDRGDANRMFMKKTARSLRALWARHDVAAQIKQLKDRIAKEKEIHDRYEVEKPESRKTVEIDLRLEALHGEAKGLVAIDGPMQQVIPWLMDENNELEVVSIVGHGGLGKTTLAMEVYRKIKEGFECRASVSVSRTLDLAKLLKDVLSQIDQHCYSRCQSERWEKEQLIREIRRILTGKRYFIVIDDVWCEQDWKFVKTAFPENNNGSRIIATTRNNIVANSSCSNSGDQVYKMEPLNQVDSERLFFKRIFCADRSCPPDLETVSARILKKCGGLPLAIITMASLLANKPENKAEWERLQDSIGIDSSLENGGNLKVMKDILLLSYWDLPHHLKTCLLYLCIYPEDNIIECKELKYKWIAEGFIAPQWGNLYHEAENCLIELVNRSMIQPVDVDYDSSIEYCRVHDMVLDFIVSLSEEENFATVLNGRECNFLPSKIRRLSLQSSGQDHTRAGHAITESKLRLRSLNLFGKFEQIPTLVEFHALRVLDLKGQVWLQNKDIKSIGSLSQLRYLRLHSRKITVLPEEIGKLRHLETLDLRDCWSIRRMPSTVVRLQKLVRLFVHSEVVLPAYEFGSMQALEEVSFIGKIDNSMKFAEELGHLKNLRKLAISFFESINSTKRGDNEENVLKLLRSSLSESCKYNLGCLLTNGDIGDYLFRDPSYTFPHLQDLQLYPQSERVPKGMASLENLVKLSISLLSFDEEDLSVLMGMPSLAHLDLCVLDLADVKRKLTVGINGFKLLKMFYYYPMCNGTGIEFAQSSMPALRRFHIRLNVKEVMTGYCGGADLGLEHLSSLAHLQVKINCYHAIPGELDAVEGSIEKALALHPNRQSLQVHVSRTGEQRMFKDDKERKEKLSAIAHATATLRFREGRQHD